MTLQLRCADLVSTAFRNKIGAAQLQRHQQEEQYKALRNEGVPVTEIADYIASSFKSGNGLTQLVIAPDMNVSMQGESINESLMIDTYQSLQRCPFLTSIRIVHFGKMSPEQGVGVMFEIDGK